MGSADGGKLRRWPLTQEAERGLGAFFQGGQVQTPGLFSSPHLAGLALATARRGLRPSQRAPELGGTVASLSPFPGRPLPGDEQAAPRASLNKLFRSPSLPTSRPPPQGSVPTQG